MTSTDRKPLADVMNPVTGKVYWAKSRYSPTHPNRAVKECPECLGTVVFHQSPKSGKWYLCEAFPMNVVDRDPDTGTVARVYEYDPANPHFQRCADRKKSLEHIERQQEGWAR